MVSLTGLHHSVSRGVLGGNAAGGSLASSQVSARLSAGLRVGALLYGCLLLMEGLLGQLVVPGMRRRSACEGVNSRHNKGVHQNNSSSLGPSKNSPCRSTGNRIISSRVKFYNCQAEC